MQPSGLITLLTDFGTSDVYAGVMKGVIATVNPRARTVDLTHDVPPQDVHDAAWLLRAAYRHFPDGTVHLVVVDPGVGGARRAIAVRAGAWYFVGPDNGVLSPALELPGAHAVEPTERAYWLPDVSRTFHGRDVFAPVAAHLSAGVPIDALGTAIDDPVALRAPRADVGERAIAAHVVRADRFGNLITDLDEATFRRWSAGGAVVVEAAGRAIGGVSDTYADGAPGALLALFGSSGALELAVRDGSAAAALSIGRGAVVNVRRAGA